MRGARHLHVPQITACEMHRLGDSVRPHIAGAHSVPLIGTGDELRRRADRRYRDLIDRLVHDCRSGQGQIDAHRARAGVWNEIAAPDLLPEQHAINLLLARMPEGDREILARMLTEAFSEGVFTALVALHEARIEPFDKGYEGTPFHDFVGRMDEWHWPEAGERT